MSIPAVMVFLSLALRPEVNRWVNIILGATYAAIMILTMLMDAWDFYIFFGIVEVILGGLIVRYAWKWPRQKNSE
jgi:hypothetical protein